MASAISPVATKPIAVSSSAPASWNAAVKNTYDHGPEVDMSPFPLTRGLADIQGATNQPHKADYMNLWGGHDTQGKFTFSSVTLVSEDWQMKGDQVHIDQWLIQANPDGSGIQATHGYVDEKVGGTVVGTGNYPATSAEAAAKLSSLTDKFATLQPKKSFAKVTGQATKHVGAALTANGFALRAPTAKAGVSIR